MKKIVVVLICLLFSAFILPDGKQLENGTYDVQYDRQFKEQYHNFKLVINGSKAVISGNDRNNDARVEWMNHNQFRLILEGEKQDSLNEIQKQLSTLGEPYYEISKWRNNKISFTLRHNPHIIINSGVFIKER